MLTIFPIFTRISSSISIFRSSSCSWRFSEAASPGGGLSLGRLLPSINELLSVFIKPEIARVIYGAMFMAVIIFMPDGMVDFLEKRGDIPRGKHEKGRRRENIGKRHDRRELPYASGTKRD